MSPAELMRNQFLAKKIYTDLQSIDDTSFYDSYCSQPLLQKILDETLIDEPLTLKKKVLQ